MSKTEEQIIQALETCQTDKACTSCPYYAPTNMKCISQLASDASSLIKRQKAELEMLKKRIQHLLQSNFIASFDEKAPDGSYKRNIVEADSCVKTENEVREIAKATILPMIKQTRTEAIKEFAEELIINLDGDIGAYANAGHGLNVYEWLVSYLNSKGAIENEHWEQ